MPIRTVHPAQAANVSTSVQPKAGHGFLVMLSTFIVGQVEHGEGRDKV